MKLLIASDIHGDYDCCSKLLENFEKEHCDNMILLGDVLYHGPRNGLPYGYDTMKTATLLNSFADRIMCVRGNCDAQIDEMVLDFHFAGDSLPILCDNYRLFATHGHLYNQDNPPKIKSPFALLCGHTHIPSYEEKGNFVYLNPGSVSIPKGGSQRSFMIFEDGVFEWKSLTGPEFVMAGSELEKFDFAQFCKNLYNLTNGTEK